MYKKKLFQGFFLGFLHMTCLVTLGWQQAACWIFQGETETPLTTNSAVKSFKICHGGLEDSPWDQPLDVYGLSLALFCSEGLKSYRLQTTYTQYNLSKPFGIKIMQTNYYYINWITKDTNEYDKLHWNKQENKQEIN